VGDHVGIGMAGQAALAVEPHTAEHQRAARVVAEAVHVEPLADPDLPSHRHARTSTLSEGSTVTDVMTDADLLAAAEFFAEVPEDQLGGLAVQGTRRSLVRGDLLFAEGDDPDQIYVVVSGRIAIARKSVDGRESVVALMETGDLFGEMGLLDQLPRSAEARALETSTVLSLPYAPVRDLFEKDPALLWSMVRLLSRRLRTMDEALADSVFLDVTGRTAKRLLELAGDKDEFVLPVTQEELAGMVGASRERVNKAIASFIRLGWIEQQDRRYRILLRDRITQRAR
jgi:CRP-like cAMP-binding protein